MKKNNETMVISDYRKEIIEKRVSELGMKEFLERTKKLIPVEIRYAARCAERSNKIWHGIGWHLDDLLDAGIDLDILRYAINLALEEHNCQQIILHCLTLSRQGIEPETITRAVKIASNLNCDSVEVIRHCRELVSLGIKPSAIKHAAEYIIKSNKYVDQLVYGRERLLEIGLGEKFIAKIVSSTTKGYYPDAWLEILENSAWFIKHGVSQKLLTSVAKTAIKNECASYVIALATKLDKVGVEREVFQLAVTTALEDDNPFRRGAHYINDGLLETIKHSDRLIHLGVNCEDIVLAAIKICSISNLSIYDDEHIKCIREVVKHHNALLQIGVPHIYIDSAIDFIANNDPDGASYIVRHKSCIRKHMSKFHSDIAKEMRQKLGIDSYEKDAVMTLARNSLK